MSALPQVTRELPEVTYDPGYSVHRIRAEFEDLCRVIGFEAARREVAEIINERANGRRQ